MPRKNKFYLQVGRARHTDQRIVLRCSKSSANRLAKMAEDDGVIFLTEDQLILSMASRPEANGPKIAIAEICKTNPILSDLPFKKCHDDTIHMANGSSINFVKAKSPVIVPSSVPADFANKQFGNAYGVDWEYERKAADMGAAKPKETLLEEAARIIYGDREQVYGNPRFNLDTIAQLWSVYLKRKFPEHQNPFINDMDISAEDVAQLMILLKTARLIHNPTHHDSLVDQAGYAALQERIQGVES